MIIDEDILNGGITSEIVRRLIERHEAGLGRLEHLYDYYCGRQAINSRARSAKGAANNKLMCNHAKYIVDMVQSYLAGNPISYAAAQEYDIEELKNEYFEQDIAALDSEIVKNMCIYGRAYELVYADGDGKPRSALLRPENAFVCYSQSADERPLFGVYYYRKYDIDGYCRGAVCRVYDSERVYVYEGLDTFAEMTITSVEEHYFGGVPIVEYKNNAERQGDFEQVISLIDAYNVLMSDRVNDKEQFVNSFLFLVDCDIDGEQARELMSERILMGHDGAKAEYLSKTLDESDTRVLRDDIKEDIHRLSHVPDLSDESFGNNLSGVAIKYKLLGFEQHIKNKERCLSRALRARFALYNKFLAAASRMALVPTHRVDIVFTYNLPANELETAQMISYLTGLASSETLLDQLPFVTDAKEEAELAKNERAEKSAENIRAAENAYRSGVSYNEE